MDKFKRILLLVLMISLLFVSSCYEDEVVDTLDELDEAMDRFKETSYTINSTFKIKLFSQYKNGNYTSIVKDEMEIDMYVQSDEEKTFMTMVLEDEKQYSYTVIEGEYVKQYVKVDDKWKLVDTAKNDEQSSSYDLFEIDVKETFTLVDGVWIGNCDELSFVLSETVKEIANSLSGASGDNIKKSLIEKYNITTAHGEVSMIDITLAVYLSESNVSTNITISMPLNISNVGETVVTGPEDLPIE